MDQEIKKRWVDALLSGEYEQGFGKLHHDGRFCCLGVYQAIAPNIESIGFIALLNEESSGLDIETQKQLAHVNDSGVPFEMIAGLIDEAL